MSYSSFLAAVGVRAAWPPPKVFIARNVSVNCLWKILAEFFARSDEGRWRARRRLPSHATAATKVLSGLFLLSSCFSCLAFSRFILRLVVIESLLALWAVDLHINWARISKAGHDSLYQSPNRSYVLAKTLSIVFPP